MTAMSRMGLDGRINYMLNNAGSGGQLDLKHGRVTLPGRCPLGKECLETLTFCGMCVEWSVPGNVLLGFLANFAGAGRANTLLFSALTTPDSNEDWASINAGYNGYREMPPMMSPRHSPPSYAS